MKKTNKIKKINNKIINKDKIYKIKMNNRMKKNTIN